jgi:hypothetical protein
MVPAAREVLGTVCEPFPSGTGVDARRSGWCAALTLRTAKQLQKNRDRASSVAVALHATPKPFSVREKELFLTWYTRYRTFDCAPLAQNNNEECTPPFLKIPSP